MPELLDPPITQRVLDRLRREAVVLAPIVLAIYSVWPEDVPVTSYKVWAPVVIGALLRQFFTSPTHEVEDREAKAYREGLLMADVSREARRARLQAEAALPPLYPVEGDDVPPF